MGLRADEKDVCIAQLALSLTVTNGKLDDALAMVTELRAEVESLKSQLTQPKKNGAHVG